MCQWVAGPSGSIYYNGGNVGVNDSSPQESLSIDNGANGDISVGTATNNKIFLGTFQNAGSVAINRRVSDGSFANPNLGTAEMALFATNGGGYISFGTSDANDTIDAERMRITQTGNVGIGTSNPQYLLSVNGTIHAKEVLVNTGWPDYVFDPKYRLESLNELATYIKRNHHLPGMPTAADVETKGVSVGAVEAKLLAKVEELTLQMIQLNERNKVLQSEISGLRVQIRSYKVTHSAAH